MKRLSIFALTLAMILLTVGCANDNNEKSELQLGMEALVEEKVQEAKEHFDKAAEGDKNQAKEYVYVIEAAELIQESLKEDDLEAAIDVYEANEENDKFPQVTFIFAEDQAKLIEVLDERKKIDHQLNVLLDFFNPEDPEMSANELYILKTNDLLNLTYLTQEQEAAIKEFQEEVQKRIAELGTETKSGQQSPGKQENQEGSGKQETDKQESDKQEEQKPDEKDPSKEKEEDESKQLTHEEGKTAVYKYLYGDDYVDSGTSEDSNFKLDYDHDDGEKYVFHYYEVVKNDQDGGHIATLGWYAVHSKTGEVTDIMK